MECAPQRWKRYRWNLVKVGWLVEDVDAVVIVVSKAELVMISWVWRLAMGMTRKGQMSDES